mgnify:CR=1 FL=1
MTALTNDAENRILNHLCRGTAFTPTTPLKLALYTVTPSETGGGTEVSGGGYVRQNITFGSAATNGSISNTVAITFPVATANWGTVNGVAILDSSATPIMIWYANASSAKTIELNDQYVVPVGALVISAD